MSTALQHEKAVLTGKNNRAAGELWESLIEASCAFYARKGAAEIAKTPEPMRPIRSMGKGQFLCYFTKRAQPDYKGTLKGGQAIVFEAKHTDTGKIRQDAVTQEQAAQLDAHQAMGAECDVLVSFGFEQFFMVPWEVFRDMKARFGRKYAKPEELEEYRVAFRGGVVRFLE